jgi:hypothetical protein
MAITISKLYIKTFESNVRHLAQQQVSRLRAFVTEKNAGTSSNSWPRLAAVEMVDKTVGRTSTPEVDGQWTNRVATPSVKHVGDTVEPEDTAQSAVDPGSNIVRNFASASNRKVDDIIIAAASGAAHDEAEVDNELPAGQKIGGATEAFDYAMVTDAVEIFLSNDIGPEIPKVAVISPNCAKRMLDWDEVTNSQYNKNAAQVLQTSGFIGNFLGFNWVVSTRLAVPGANQRKCLFFTKMAIGLLMVQDLWTEIAKDPSKSFLTRFYAAINCGAVRVEDEHVVEATVLETA